MTATVPRRVHVVGSPGSGKSTLAARLAAELGVRAQDLDHLPPPPDSVTSPAPPGRDAGVWDHFSRRAADLAAGERWITEGIYSGWTAPLLEQAESIVWLDLPATLAVRRIVWRHLRRSLARDNPHQGLRLLTRFCWYVLRDPSSPAATDAELRADVGANSRATVEERLRPFEGKVVHCRTPADVDQLLVAWGVRTTPARHGAAG